MVFLFNSCCVIAGWIAILCLAVCIASGLYVASEIAEENATFMRKVLKNSIGILIVAHVFLFIDSVPLKYAMGGILCNLAYLPLLRTFPTMEVVSIPTIMALSAGLLNQVLWLYFFTGDVVKYESNVDIKGVIGFFLVFVWYVPVGFLISMTLPSETLPPACGMMGAGVSGNTNYNGSFGNSNNDYYNGSGGGSGQARNKRQPFFQTMIDAIWKKNVSSSMGASKNYYS